MYHINIGLTREYYKNIMKSCQPEGGCFLKGSMIT